MPPLLRMRTDKNVSFITLTWYSTRSFCHCNKIRKRNKMHTGWKEKIKLNLQQTWLPMKKILRNLPPKPSQTKPKQKQKKLVILELINELIKITAYKINIYKSIAFLYTDHGQVETEIINTLPGLPWWRSGWESACQRREHGFEPWSGKIPHTAEQLGPWATTTEPARLEPMLRNRERPQQWRGPRTAMKSGPRSPQLEKALAENRRPNTAKNKITK